MIKIDRKEDCCGCNACGDICPTGAISYEEDEEGFFYPKINEDNCINCGLCMKTCPIKHWEELKRNDYVKPICIAANHKRLDIRFDSTSGGAFTALAEPFVSEGGYTGGAVYTENWKVKQILSNKLSDLSRLRSSKYIQSNAIGYYSEIKNLLAAGEKVLAVGLPCQIAGVKAFLGKDYDNLITVDLICRYINSPFAYEKYLEYLEKEFKSKVVYIKPKNKEMGWRKLTHKVVFKNGKTYYGIYGKDKFMQASMHGNCLSRPSCYECVFKGFPRIADISIGDYWGNKNETELDDDTGTSVIMINSKKGEEYYNHIKRRLKTEIVPFDKVLAGNPALTESLPKPIVNKELFFKKIVNDDFGKVVDELCPLPGLSWRQKIRNICSVAYRELKYSKGHLKPLIQFVYLNFFHPAVKGSIIKRHVIYTTPNCLFEISNKASIILNGFLVVGNSPFSKSRLETRIRMERGSQMIIGDFSSGGYGFGYGSDIELFENAVLESKGGPSTNMNTTIICMSKIVIGQVVAIGRNVTIRDNNGGHLININGYQDTLPVIIGEHVWLCEGCTILSGVKIGDGTIIGARSVVNKSFPSHVTVSGNPAKIGTEGIEWKM